MIPLVLLLTSYKMNAFDEDYYHEQFENNNIYDGFNMNKTELHEINHILLDYLQGNKHKLNTSSVNTDFFNEKEQTHLSEVKMLIKGISSIFYFLLIVFILLFFIVYMRNKKKFWKNVIVILISGGILNILLILLLGGFVFVNFSGFFLKFHLTAFESDTWLLNPATDNLIKMFPEKFFFELGLKIVLNSLFFSIIMILILFYIKIILKKS